MSDVAERLLYAGSSVHPEPEGILAWRLRGGQLKPLDLGVLPIPSAHSLALQPGGRILLAAHDPGRDPRRPTGVLSSFVRQSDGSLNFLGSVPSLGNSPNTVTVHPLGRYAITTHYTGVGDLGSLVVHPIREDGFLLPASDRQTHGGRGLLDDRQSCSHVHHVRFSPGGEYVVVADLGIDTVFVLGLDCSTGKLLPHDRIALPAGSGPRHVAFAPDGHHLFCVTEIGNTLVTLAWDDAGGRLTTQHETSTLPASFEATNSAADIAVHPSGQWILTTNRGHDSIAVLAVEPESGKTLLQECVPSGGRTPRALTMDESGSLVFVGNRAEGEVRGFSFDAHTGQLSPNGLQAAVRGPVPLLLCQLPRSE